MKRSLVVLALLTSTACAEEETPTIIEGTRGACGSVIQGATPSEVECPASCPFAVEAFRIRDVGTCERSAAKYVACVGVSGGAGRPGAGVLDTPDGYIFVDSPAFDCNGEEGCVTIDTAVQDRWSTCGANDVDGCECVCDGGDCPHDRFVADISACGLPSPCEPLTGDAEPTVDQLQCYMDALAEGGPIKIEADVTSRNSVTGELVASRQVLAVNEFEVIRLDRVAYDSPSVRCDLKAAGFFLGCDPEEPTVINVENEDGLIERVPCTDPVTWMDRCDEGDPVCPGGGG